VRSASPPHSRITAGGGLRSRSHTNMCSIRRATVRPTPAFTRAFHSGDVALIHATAAELGWVPVRDALAIRLVIDARDEERFGPAAVRLAGRFALEVRDLTLSEFRGAGLASCAAARERSTILQGLTERAVRPPGVAR